MAQTAITSALYGKFFGLKVNSLSYKFVIEKLDDGKVSGYFIAGMMNEGLKPVKKGDAMTETFTDGFVGEVKCKFSNVPVM